MVEGVRVCKPGFVYPQRSYIKQKAAIGLVEVDGAVPFTVAAKMILEKHDVALLRPFLLGSATSTLVFAGNVDDVRNATSPKWLMENEVLGRFHKRNPLIGTACFENPSRALWEVMQDLEPIPAPPLDLTGEKLTLGIFETLRMGPFLRALEHLRKKGNITYIGFMNVGSKHKSVFFAGEQDQVESAKWTTKDYIRELMAAKQINGEYDGSWFLPLDPTHHDLTFLLPWGSNKNPFREDVSGSYSYLAIETQGLVALLTAIDNAAKRGGAVIASRELGSGTETGILVSPWVGEIAQAGNEGAILDACGRNPKGRESVLNILRFDHPEDVFAAHMSDLKPAEPRFDMAGMSLGLVDTVHRGLLYDALHTLRKYEVGFVGTRKIGSKQTFMAFAGSLGQVEATLKEIKEEAEDKLSRKERTGELYSLGVVENPHKEVLRLLPWQALSEYRAVAPEGKALPHPYYQPGQPFAFIETLGLAHQIAIANAIFRKTGIAPVSRYGVGSGLEVFHYASEEYELLRQIVERDFLLKACEGMPNTEEMLLNAAAYAEPGEALWEAVDNMQSVSTSAISTLTAPGVAVGLFTARGMVPTLYFLDRLKDYEDVNLWGMQKSGGLYMTDAIYGPLAQVQDAINTISSGMLVLHASKKLSGEMRSWKVIANPHENLAFVLPRSRRVGV